VTILNVLAPVFLLIVLGGVLQRTGFVSATFLREANRVTYWLGLPALLFSSLASSLHEAEGAKPMLYTMLAATLLVVIVAYLAAWMLGVKSSAAGTFVQGAFRGNLAYIGLPIIYTLPDVPAVAGVSTRAAAVVAVAPMLVLYNVLGVMVLLASQHPVSWRMAKPLTKQLLTTPPLIATVLGIAWAVFALPLPRPIALAFDWLGQMALPLALLGIGGALAQMRVTENKRSPLTAALLKTGLSPLFGYVLGRYWGLAGIELATVMIFLATPTAAISYVMASQLQGDEALASSTILFSTLISVVSLSVIVGVF
jgi:malate permease and related proteins